MVADFDVIAFVVVIVVVVIGHNILCNAIVDAQHTYQIFFLFLMDDVLNI